MNILTFDIEEWFHLFENPFTDNITKWSSYESRIHSNMDRLFLLLEKRKQCATFFCLGWIAEKYPDIIRDIIGRGYEIGSHTTMHELVYKQTACQFRNDLISSVKTIEDIVGKKVKYFRAPGFSITEKNKWAFEVLSEEGIEIDCSVFPAVHSYGGFPSYQTTLPSIISYNGITIKELPMSYNSIFDKPIIYSGGGYFRLFPYQLIKYWGGQSDYLMSYFHPRDFDPDQPIIAKLSLLRHFKSYVGLKGAKVKLEKFLYDFDFIDIATANNLIDWENTPRIIL
jgi:polysaccharide deacetylase family protein (PEP-CTERM system associated)